MGSNVKITGRIMAAGRALAGVGRDDFARVAGIPLQRIALLEASGSAWLPTGEDVEAIARTFDHFGIVVIDEDDSMGAGVRLKFTRGDVGQIMRLEGEGGIARSDDAP